MGRHVDQSRSPASLRDIEAESGVGGQALDVHPVEHRDSHVHVVVEFDVMLVLVRPEQSTDVLNHSALERDREGQEKGVELGQSKPSPR